jgi:hypothetical protein
MAIQTYYSAPHCGGRMRPRKSARRVVVTTGGALVRGLLYRGQNWTPIWSAPLIVDSFRPRLLLLSSQRKRGKIPALPKFRSGGALVDADRDALYHAMEGR